MGTESEDDFNKLFEDLDLGSTKLGHTPDARNTLIAKVLARIWTRSISGWRSRTPMCWEMPMNT